MISQMTRKAYSEVDAFLDIIDLENREKIPEALRNLFKREKDIEYASNINIKMLVKEQKMMKETYSIIALLNIKFWCDSEEKIQDLIKIYENNGLKLKEYFSSPNA